MFRLLPRSFHRLLLIGLVLVVMPLLVGLWLSHRMLDEMTLIRHESLAKVALVERTGWEADATLGAMKRIIMRLPQPESPGRAETLPTYPVLSEQFARQLGYLAALPAAASHRPAITRLLERVRILRGDFGGQGDVSLLTGQIYQIDEEMHRILRESDRSLELEIAVLEGEATKLRRMLLVIWICSVVIAVAMLAILRHVVIERIRGMDRVIREIGQADLVPDMTVVGTPDFSDLGSRLDWLRRRLRNKEAQRTRFLRHISHDLKTPLTAICEGAQLLSEGAAGPLDPRQKPLVDIVNKNAQRLQKFIEDLLNYQQVSSARVNLELRSMRMDRLCETVLSAHIMAAGKHNVRIKRSLPEVELNGDWNKLYAVLDNLISNAIKFSPEDGVVTVNLTNEGNEVVVDVMDQGNGVPEEESKRVFEPFFRGTRARGGTIKGSGLGLAIARDYARAHRGRLELIDSAEGAHFRLTLSKSHGYPRPRS